MAIAARTMTDEQRKSVTLEYLKAVDHVTSVLLSLIGFLRWLFVVPPLARSSITGNPVLHSQIFVSLDRVAR